MPDRKMLMRRGLALALVALALCAGYIFWLRDAGVVAVEEVSVGGGGERTDLVSAVEAVAYEQTTLHVDEAALIEPIASDPAVSGLSATPDFPSGLAIELDLREPVGYIVGQGLVVAGDGVVLERAKTAPEGLALVELPSEVEAPAVGERLEGQGLLMSSVIAVAPGPLRAELSDLRVEPNFGVVASLGSIELRFGDSERIEAKWEAAAAVLADPRLGRVSYVDLSLPERPVAGAGDASAAPIVEQPLDTDPEGEEAVVVPVPAPESAPTEATDELSTSG